MLADHAAMRLREGLKTFPAQLPSRFDYQRSDQKRHAVTVRFLFPCPSFAWLGLSADLRILCANDSKFVL